MKKNFSFSLKMIFISHQKKFSKPNYIRSSVISKYTLNLSHLHDMKVDKPELIFKSDTLSESSGASILKMSSEELTFKVHFQNFKVHVFL